MCLPQELIDCFFDWDPFLGRTICKRTMSSFEDKLNVFHKVSSKDMKLSECVSNEMLLNLDFAIQRFEHLFSEDVQDGFVQNVMNMEETETLFVITVQAYVCLRLKMDSDTKVFQFLNEIYDKVPNVEMSLEELNSMIESGEHTVLECMTKCFSFEDLIYYGY